MVFASSWIVFLAFKSKVLFLSLTSVCNDIKILNVNVHYYHFLPLQLVLLLKGHKVC